MKLAIFLPNWVGDACMAIPTLRALRDGVSPNTQFIGVSRPGPAALLRDQGWFDDWLVYQPHGTQPILNRRGLVAELWNRKCDSAILMTNSLGSAAIAALSRIPRRIGYVGDTRSWLLTDRLRIQKIQGRSRPVAAIDYYLKLAEHMGCPSVDRNMKFTIDVKYHEQANQLWKKLGFSEPRPTIVINNNAANNPERLWPEAYVERLATKLVRALDVQVLLHCGPGEAHSTTRLAHRINHPRIQSMGIVDDLPLGLSQAVFARSSLVVTTDSGARHLAVAMDCPVISLFGPVQPAWTTTYNTPETVIQAEPRCHACENPSYMGGIKGCQCECMKQIKPERVFLEVLNRLKAGKLPATLEAA